MTPKKPQKKEAVLLRLTELSWWAYAVIVLIALAAALILNCLNAAKFPFIGTTTAVVAFLATTWSLAAALVRFSGNSDSGFIQSELGGGVILVLIGVIAGGVGGAVWWLAVGPEVSTLGQAAAGGAILGGFVVLLLLSGP